MTQTDPLSRPVPNPDGYVAPLVVRRDTLAGLEAVRRTLLVGKDLATPPAEGYRVIHAVKQDVSSFSAAECPHFLVAFPAVPEDFQAALAQVDACPIVEMRLSVEPAAYALVLMQADPWADDVRTFLDARTDEIRTCGCVPGFGVLARMLPTPTITMNLEHDTWCPAITMAGSN